MSEWIVMKQCASCRAVNRIRLEHGFFCRCGRCKAPLALTHYEILGVPKNATLPQIKAAYRRAAKFWHPDVHEGRDRAAAERHFRRVQDAYHTLSHPEARKRYDLLLDFEGAYPGGTQETASATEEPASSQAKPGWSAFAQGRFLLRAGWNSMSGKRQAESRKPRPVTLYTVLGVGLFTVCTIGGAILTGLFGSKLALVILLSLGLVGGMQLLYLLTKMTLDVES
ncbi:J domain-containing protein [Alicyclobacillus vulcanalis]|uniref:DnaJ domain-containing protein n=1 Tax=Alicyclobacillus vulcanalis TaxID=252246 RepID=A0A1N7LMQ7_9BACL|nr:J domain-containing protein [Alicyclobacillus vulcanalis]SIS75110.1 DnaJ domain-containing protein [Alicyclobacillus vulcanalis]